MSFATQIDNIATNLKNIKKMSSQKKATVVATTVAFVLTIIKLIVAVASGSVTVLASAIDSLLDMAMSIFNFFAIKKAEEHPSEEFQYGKGKIQAIAGVIEGSVITVSGLFVIYKAIEKFYHHEKTGMILPSIIVMAISIVVVYLLVKYLTNIADKTDNIVIKADAIHYKTDLYTNAVVLASLFLIAISGYEWIDALFGLGLGVYIIYSAFEIIKEGIEILLDRALDGDIVAKIAEIISNHPDTTSYHWLKTRTDGSTNFVEFHLVLHPEMTLQEAHDISDEIEREIRELDPKKRWVITPHYDPYDDEHLNEMALNGKK